MVMLTGLSGREAGKDKAVPLMEVEAALAEVAPATKLICCFGLPLRARRRLRDMTQLYVNDGLLTKCLATWPKQDCDGKATAGADSS